jgi:hypothetical protein
MLRLLVGYVGRTPPRCLGDSCPSPSSMVPDPRRNRLTILAMASGNWPVVQVLQTSVGVFSGQCSIVWESPRDDAHLLCRRHRTFWCNDSILVACGFLGGPLDPRDLNAHRARMIAMRCRGHLQVCSGSARTAAYVAFVSSSRAARICRSDQWQSPRLVERGSSQRRGLSAQRSSSTFVERVGIFARSTAIPVIPSGGRQ